MRKHILLILFALATPYLINAQDFTPISTGIQGVWKSSIDWGDYDNDGDLDLLLCGGINTSAKASFIYNNNNGEFEDSGISIPAMINGSATWGDVDGDKDLDILMTGLLDGETVLFLNENGSFSEHPSSGISNMGETTVSEWGDFDNDGDLDVALAGDYITHIYENQGNLNFSLYSFNIIGLNNATLRWVDYDNDGDLDLSMQGHDGTGPHFYLYKNTPEGFVETTINFLGLMSGDMQWADYDNDGDMDLIRCGFDDNLVGHTIIYRNDGQERFKNLGLSLQEAATSSAAWGDIDNDGDLDLLISGRCVGCGVIATNIYRNKGNDEFVTVYNSMTDVQRCAVSLVDFDNDGDVDPFITGENSTGNPVSHLYRNSLNSNDFHTNSNPEAPTNLQVEVSGNDVVLSWDAATDDYTPESSLTYNLCVGTSPDAYDLIVPMADIVDGTRYISRHGNTSTSRSWNLNDIADGTYYWAVQTIDHGFKGSTFSHGESFTINTIDVSHNETQRSLLYPVPATNSLHIESNENLKSVEIYTISGTMIKRFEKPSTNQFNISDIDTGIYFARIYKKNKAIENIKFMVLK